MGMAIDSIAVNSQHHTVAALRRPEAVFMDAQQRLLLEHAAQALANASTTVDKKLDVRTSVMVGIGTVDYTAMSAHLGNSLYAASGGVFLHPLQMAVLEAGCVCHGIARSQTQITFQPGGCLRRCCQTGGQAILLSILTSPSWSVLHLLMLAPWSRQSVNMWHGGAYCSLFDPCIAAAGSASQSWL